MGLVVLAAAGAGIYLFVFDTAEGAPDVALSVDKTETTTTYEHGGGQPLPVENVETVLAVGGQSARVPLTDLDSTACVRRVTPSNGSVTAGQSIQVRFEPYCTQNELTLVYDAGDQSYILRRDPTPGAGDSNNTTIRNRGADGIREVLIEYTINGSEEQVVVNTTTRKVVEATTTSVENTTVSGDGLDDNSYDYGDSIDTTGITTTLTDDVSGSFDTYTSVGTTDGGGYSYVGGGCGDCVGHRDTIGDGHDGGDGGGGGGNSDGTTTTTTTETIQITMPRTMTVEIDDRVTFDGVAYGPYPITEYNWDLGDGTTKYGRTVTHTYGVLGGGFSHTGRDIRRGEVGHTFTDTGIYYVTLTVTDERNNTANETVKVTVEPDSQGEVTEVSDTLTLQEQISQASPGDTIVVDGTFTDIEVDTRDLTLVGSTINESTVGAVSVTEDDVTIRNLGLQGSLQIYERDFRGENLTINGGDSFAVGVHAPNASLVESDLDGTGGVSVDPAEQGFALARSTVTASGDLAVDIGTDGSGHVVGDSDITVVDGTTANDTVGIRQEHGAGVTYQDNTIDADTPILRVQNQPPAITDVSVGTKISQVPTGVSATATDENGDDIVEFRWQLGDDDTFATTNDADYVGQFATAGTHNLTVKAVDEHDAVGETTVQVDVAAPTFDVLVSPDRTGTGDVATGTASTNLPANKIDTVRFDWGDGTVRNDSALQRDHVYTTPDSYTVEATLDAVSDLQLNGSDTVEVEVSPEARLNATPLYAAWDEPVTFDAADSQSYNGSLTYEWDLDPAIG
ncbi:hypothetical protein BRD17_01415, partial [Halobacteriales archaeon SW_7_68_16]